MNIVNFIGFAGIRLEEDKLGDERAPPVLMIHDGESRCRACQGRCASATK